MRHAGPPVRRCRKRNGKHPLHSAPRFCADRSRAVPVEQSFEVCISASLFFLTKRISCLLIFYLFYITLHVSYYLYRRMHNKVSDKIGLRVRLLSGTIIFIIWITIVAIDTRPFYRPHPLITAGGISLYNNIQYITVIRKECNSPHEVQTA